MNASRLARRSIPAAAGILSLLLFATASSADARCRSVEGS
jgi:hypothetical protein